MTMRAKLYHNTNCSKSREALHLLTTHDIKPDLVLYLESPPSPDELRELLRMLGLGARGLLRTNEIEYDALGLADERLSEEELIAVMVAHPCLMERPILVKDGCAVIGRPPERVLELLTP